MKTRLFPVAAVTLAVMLMATVRADAQVLQQVPSDALVVIKVRNLQEVSTKVAALAQQMGVAGLNPAMADPLAAVQQQSGIANGLDKNGEIAIFVPLSLLDNPDVEEKPAVMLWPVTDYKAFIGNFADAQTDAAGISTFKMGTNPADSHAANWGKYAAVSQSKELVAKKPAGAGLKAQGLAAKELDAKDMTFYVNIASARPKLIAKLKEARPQMLAEMDAKLSQVEDEKAKTYAPLARSLANRVLDLAEQFVNETNSATYGVMLGNEGINTTALAEFDAKSQMGQRAAQLKGSNDSLLAGLPEGKYLAFGGAALDPTVLTGIINDLIGPVEAELTKIGDNGKAISSYIDALRKMAAATQSSRFGAVAPTGKLGEEALFQMISLVTGDANALAAAQTQMFQSQEQVTALFGGGQVQAKTTITPKAKTIGGVDLDQFQSAINSTAQGAEGAQLQQMMTMMYGPNGLSGFTGVVGAKQLITVMGGGDPLLEKAIAAAKANQDVLSKNAGVMTVSKQLPQNRVAVYYLALDTIISTGVTYAQQFGLPIQLQLPADLPPLGFTAGAEGSAVRFDAHVPAQLVQSLVAAGMQAFMQMQGGRQPGGPGGL